MEKNLKIEEDSRKGPTLYDKKDSILRQNIIKFI
jgi:hypothetical protein